MAILSRSDQQKVMSQYEYEYGKLVMMYNTAGYTNNTIRAASTLLKEMNRFSQDTCYFDEDIAEVVRDLSSSITKHFFSENYAVA